MVSKSTKMSRNATKTPASKKSKQTVAKTGKPRLPTIPPGLKFVGYREQLLGSPGPSQPHRRMRRWWLKDGEGNEHAAVETVQWDEQNKRFEYSPSPEFAEMLEMTCYSHKSVYEYLDLFLHPEKYVEIAGEEEDATDAVKKEKSPAEAKKRKRPATGNDTKSSGKGTAAKETGTKKKATGIKRDTKKGGKKPGDLLKNVSKELATLQATYGIRYTLTVIGPHGDVKVISSPTVERIDIDPHEMEGFAYPLKLNMLSDAVFGVTEEMEKNDKSAGNELENASIQGLEEVAVIEDKGIETNGEQDDNKDSISMDVFQGEEVSGIKTLVTFVKESEDSQYLPGSFWRRDPFPSTGLQNTRDHLEIAPDVGQLRDVERVKSFLMIEQKKLPSKSDTGLKCYESEPSPCSVNDFVIAPVWGIDTYTRGLFDLALASCQSGILSRDKRNQFFSKYFLPCLNKLEYHGWDTLKALETISQDSNVPEEFSLAARNAIHILQKVEETGGTGVEGKRHQPLRPSGRKFSRSHPKGDGVILRRGEGMKSDTFVGQYFGDLYTSWRFFEKDSSKPSRANTKSQSIINTHTMTLERPNVDKKGYSVLYIDATQSGNFISRMNHSCDPNCEIKAFVVNNELKVGVWSVKDIEDGEEMTIDFRTKGDFERELQSLTCLCGSEHCEKNFVNMMSIASPINSCVSEKYSILHRTKIILECGTHGLTRSDSARLERYGFKDLILHDEPQSEFSFPLPKWLKSWASQTLKFIEEESVDLKTILHDSEKNPDSIGFSEIDIKRLASTRVKMLSVALDKARFFLSNQAKESCTDPPLLMLGDRQVADHLWTGANSIAVRAVKVLENYIGSLASSAIGSKRSSRQTVEQKEKAPWWQVTPNGEPGKGRSTSESNNNSVKDVVYLSKEEVLAKMKQLLKEESPQTISSAQKALRRMAEVVAEGGPLHAGLHDVLQLYSYTKNFFSQTEFKPFKPYLADGKVGTRYRSSFIWALLCGWYRNAGDVVDALCNDRKGVLCLPDIECCYLPAFTNGEYMVSDERGVLISFLKSDTTSVWPRNLTSFTFKTSTKCFGSPQFDQILAENEGKKMVQLSDVADTIEQAFVS